MPKDTVCSSPKGWPQRQHQLADAEAVRIPEVGDWQARCLDLDQGQVHPVVQADEASFEAAAVGELHLDALGIAHDVSIRHQIAILTDEEARPEARRPSGVPPPRPRPGSRSRG
jgi:hypothetical protein